MATPCSVICNSLLDLHSRLDGLTYALLNNMGMALIEKGEVHLELLLFNCSETMKGSKRKNERE